MSEDFRELWAISMHLNFMIYKVFNYDLQRSTKILRTYPKWIQGKALPRKGRKGRGRKGRQGRVVQNGLNMLSFDGIP